MQRYIYYIYQDACTATISGSMATLFSLFFYSSDYHLQNIRLWLAHTDIGNMTWRHIR